MSEHIHNYTYMLMSVATFLCVVFAACLSISNCIIPHEAASILLRVLNHHVTCLVSDVLLLHMYTTADIHLSHSCYRTLV